VRSADGKLAARVTTGSDGRFRILLRPGRYRVSARPVTGGALPRCPGPKGVKVGRTGFTRVSIDCDSGIR
jgi:hypothetical protein